MDTGFFPEIHCRGGAVHLCSLGGVAAPPGRWRYFYVRQSLNFSIAQIHKNATRIFVNYLLGLAQLFEKSNVMQISFTDFERRKARL